jgi:probable HAF family extracellular repeat protein
VSHATTVSLLRPSLLALCVAGASSMAQAEVQGLGFLPNGGSGSYAYGVSADGSVVVGVGDRAGAFYEAFRWTQAGGMQGLGYLPGQGFGSWADEVSADGTVVVGASFGTADYEAFRWTQAGGMQSLGDLPGGGYYSEALGVSADGAVVVGISASTSGHEAFRWTQASGMQGLGDLAGGEFYSHAFGVSADGAVVVGRSESASGYEAFHWTQAGGMQGLGDLAGGFFRSEAYGVSADGAVVVGSSDSASGYQAFRWTQTGGMQGLGDLAGGYFSSVAHGVSADGSVVAGSSVSDYGDEAFRWTQATGMQSLSAWLQDNGIDSSDWFFGDATVSADGSTFVGVGQHLGETEAFVARAQALVTLADLSSSLNASAQAFGASQRSLRTMINGAHSRPLSRRVASGQSTGWLAGDWSKDEHGNRNGDIGLAEIGGGHNFGPLQVNMAVGQTWANQQQPGDSKTGSDGTYLLSEAIVPISEHYGLWATVGGYAAWGENEIKRGYQNGGQQDHSSASPDTQSYGLRARLDWENAVQLGLLQVSPYTDLSYAHGKQDSYSETAGGLPAQFDQQTDSTTDLSFGVGGSYPLGQSGFNLISLLETTHRFEKSGASQSGQVTGLFAFDLPGNDHEQNWQRLGLGVEGQVCAGKASLMLNGTTEGEMPSTWLAASYQLAF